LTPGQHFVDLPGSGNGVIRMAKKGKKDKKSKKDKKKNKKK
jgi:hypothetical protein